MTERNDSDFCFCACNVYIVLLILPLVFSIMKNHLVGGGLGVYQGIKPLDIVLFTYILGRKRSQKVCFLQFCNTFWPVPGSMERHQSDFNEQTVAFKLMRKTQQTHELTSKQANSPKLMIIFGE